MKKRYTFSSKTWLCAWLLTSFAASFSLNLQAQTSPTKLWDKTFGGNDYDYLWSIKQTSDGGYSLGGGSKSNITGDKCQASKGK